ncbi:MAG: FkbM family methyltransferase [Pirellulales bacterium]
MFARNEDLKVIEEVFMQRRYATLFPFHKESAVVVDIGAHCGSFSLFAALGLDSSCNIYSFEPDAENFELAKRNLDRNNKANVALERMGVGGQTEEREFFKAGLATAQHSTVTGMTIKDGDVQKVQVIGAEDLFTKLGCTKIDFLKIDCEGAEYDFFYNASPEILKQITTISMEFHDLDSVGNTGLSLAKFFVAQGFSVVDIENEPTRHNRSFGRLLVTRQW